MLCVWWLMLDVVLFFCGVFFFKQKTAYEMRISDWSSDVCSSDLLDDAADGDGDQRKEAEQADIAFERLVAEALFGGLGRHDQGSLLGGNGRQRTVRGGVMTGFGHRLFDPEQIGSASCWARVFQYV